MATTADGGKRKVKAYMLPVKLIEEIGHQAVTEHVQDCIVVERFLRRAMDEVKLSRRVAPSVQ